jgi:hypothetical protein
VYRREASDWAHKQAVPPSFHSATECFAVAAYQLGHDPRVRERVEYEQDEITVIGEEIGGESRLNADGSPADDHHSFAWLWADELAEAVFRRSAPPSDAGKKRKRGGTPDEPELGPFVPVPERWQRRQAPQRKEGTGWVNIDESDDEQDERAVSVADSDELEVPETASEEDEPALPASPPPLPSPRADNPDAGARRSADRSSTSPASAAARPPSVEREVIEILDSDEELYGDGATNDPWVNDEMTDEE